MNAQVEDDVLRWDKPPDRLNLHPARRGFEGSAVAVFDVKVARCGFWWWWRGDRQCVCRAPVGGWEYGDGVRPGAPASRIA